MSLRSFSLKPFPSTVHSSGIQIKGSIERRSNILTICYELFGLLEGVVIPAPADKPCRRNGLWEETCFEFFIAEKNSDRYWEFNLSPAGHWNVYRFTSYRQGMQEEPAIASLQFRTEHPSDLFRLSMELDLYKIVSADEMLEAAVNAVVKSKIGSLSYWALTHSGTKADFHRRDGFIIAL